MVSGPGARTKDRRDADPSESTIRFAEPAKHERSPGSPDRLTVARARSYAGGTGGPTVRSVMSASGGVGDSVTGSELAFLAMGLGLGIAAGVVVLAILRRRADRTREVRITVTPGAIPRRQPSTLADLGQADPGTPWAAARGGPGDHGELAAAARPIAATSDPEARTPVLAGTDGTAAQAIFRLADPVARTPVATVPPQSIAVSGGIDPMLAALRASAAASAEQALAALEASAVAVGAAPAAAEPAGSSGWAGSAGSAEPARSSGTVALAAGRGSRRAEAGSGAGTPESSAATTEAGAAANGGSDPRSPGDAGPCDGARRIAEERCTLAERARAQATNAEDAHRAAQRAYDEHEAASSEASDAADARAVRRAKDEAQARFREGRASAVTSEQVEAAARAWLEEINRINTTARDGAAALTRERARGQQLALALETTSLAAEAARIAAETAEAACLTARETLAECEEQRVAEATGSFPAVPSGAPLAGGGGAGDGGDDDPLAGALGAGGSPRIFRLIQGDRTAMHEIVTALADGDPEERRRWQLALADLVDAVLADALAASALEFPPDHAFWGLFTPSQARDIAAALSSLGFRFDGLGGWSDERVPSQRDLSLALGYAGLDPMRMRHWPTEREMAELYAEVRVSAAEHLAGAAGDLTLGELVTMLGRRADGLADIWNEWGRIRPLLLSEA